MIGCSKIWSASESPASMMARPSARPLPTSVNRLRDSPAKSKIIILLTDGMNNTGKISPMAAAEAAKALGVKIYTIAVGVRGEAPMPVKDEFRQHPAWSWPKSMWTRRRCRPSRP